MTHQGDDCYFYFYSTCAKGDNCLFRHCEAALGSETICTLWQEGRCFRQVCKFRHMEIDKRRSEIPCYWEKQPTGCTKLNCAFRHSMPRFVEGVFFPATKGVQTKQEVSEAADEPILPQLPVNQLQQPKIPIQSNPSPQVRGVMKLEASENVPSPTHPPVVINAADDDEDDDDQFSEGEENKNTQPPTAEEQNGIRVTSAKRQAVPVKKDCTLDFGIKTLEQIRQKKFMKENVKKMDELPTDLATQTQKVEPNRENLVIEKENVRTVFRKVTVSPKKLAINEGELPFKRSLAERLGKKKVMPKETPEELPVKAEIETTLKRNLSERLGKRKILAEDGSEEVAQKVQNPRSIRERLGLPADITTAENEKPVTKTEGSGEIRVKTLDEIRREKAAKRDLVDGNGDFIVGVAGLNKSTQASSFLEEASQIIRTVRVKTASESLLKKQGQPPVETGKINPSKKHPEATPRKEQNPGLGKDKGKGQKVAPDEVVTKPKPLEQVRVKTLEEIRREKALRRHGTQESLATPQESEKPKNETPPTRKRLLRITKPIEAVQPEKADVEPMDVQSVDAATTQGDTRERNKSANGKESLRLQKVQVKSFEEILKEKRLRQLQEIEKPPNQTLPGEEAAANKMGCDIQAGDQNSQSAASEPRTNSRLGTEQPVVMTDGKLTTARPEVAEPPRALKVKPKLNVKPSFVKNSCPVRPNPKRKSPDSHPSSIMAVKPLNTGATDLTRQPPAGSTIAPTALPEQAEEVTSLTSQVAEKSKERNIDLAGQGKSTSVSQSEIKSFSPPQVPAKARRLSSTASKSATTEDDFEELMKEFSDDKLEAEIDLDPGKDEDDLLLELSEMIDS